MAKIIIKRKSAMGGSAQSHDVYLLNTFVGELKNGGTLEIPVDVGYHTLTFKSKMKKFGKDASFTAVINDESEIVEIKTKFAMSGEYEVEYGDNKPHIPTVSNTMNTTDTNTTDNVQKPGGIRCTCCGSTDILPVSDVTTKGKDFKTGDACCGYMLCGPLGLLFGAAGKGKQTISTTYWMCKNCGNKFKA